MSINKKRIFEIIEKAEKGDKASRYFDSLILILIFLNSFFIVLESFNNLYEKWYFYFKTFEVFSVIIFSIEYLLRIWTSDLLYEGKRGKIKSITKYILSPMAVIDLLSILPFYLPMLIPIDLRFLRLFRVFRLLRILKINRYTKALSLILCVVREKKEELAATIFMMGFMILISSTIMYYFESEAQPEAFPNIVASFWWAIATLTTVGYGDVYPVTVVGKFSASIIALMGIGIVALPTGIISSGFIEAVSKKNEEEKEEEFNCPHCGKEIKRK